MADNCGHENRLLYFMITNHLYLFIRHVHIDQLKSLLCLCVPIVCTVFQFSAWLKVMIKFNVKNCNFCHVLGK